MAQVARIAREGLEARFARHEAMAERTRAVAGGRVLAPAGARSPTVTCIQVDDGPAAVAQLAQAGYTVGYGYAELRPTTFRIGHMGDQSVETLEPLLDLCRTLLR